VHVFEIDEDLVSGTVGCHEGVETRSDMARRHLRFRGGVPACSHEAVQASTASDHYSSPIFLRTAAAADCKSSPFGTQSAQ
jgi:hypothetical protein